MSFGRIYTRSYAQLFEHAFRRGFDFEFSKLKCDSKSLEVIFSLFRLSITGTFECIKNVNSFVLIFVAFVLSFTMALPKLFAAMIKTPFYCNDPLFEPEGEKCDTVWSKYSEKDCYEIFEEKKFTNRSELMELCNIDKSWRLEACDEPYVSFVMSANGDLSFSEIFSDRKIAFFTFQIIICRIFPFAIIGNLTFFSNTE